MYHTVNINIEDAKPGMKLAKSVYIITMSGTPLLAARKDTALDEDVIRMLISKNVRMVSILEKKEGPEIFKNEIYVPIEAVLGEKLKGERNEKITLGIRTFGAGCGNRNRGRPFWV